MTNKQAPLVLLAECPGGNCPCDGMGSSAHTDRLGPVDAMSLQDCIDWGFIEVDDQVWQ